MSLFAAARHPEVVQGIALWWISGGVMGQMTLGNVYCAPNIRAAWKDDMTAVADLPDWAEVIERNRDLQMPAIVFRSGASDPNHPRATTDAVAGLLPNARLVDPPWGDREWHTFAKPSASRPVASSWAGPGSRRNSSTGPTRS